MKIYDPIIRSVSGIEKNKTCRIYTYNRQKAWPENEDYECIFQKDTALTLGGAGQNGCNMICATTDPSFFHGDETVLIGPDIGELKGNVPFARIVLLQTEEILPEEILPEEILSNEISRKEASDKAERSDADHIYVGDVPDRAETGKTRNNVRSTEKAFRILQQMDFVKYHIYPKGYMARVSGQSASEQVRISRKALSAGISFERIGNTYLRHYKENPMVLQAKVIFITAPDIDYKALSGMAEQAEQLRNSLSVIMKGIATDCGSCSIREICNEIEGLRELHFGREGVLED